MAIRQRRFCFTDFKNKPAYDPDAMRYLKFGEEICPTTGRFHYQGYVEMYKAVTIKVLKKWFPKAKLFACKGSLEKNQAYTGKGENVQEFGSPAMPGVAQTFQSFVNAIKSGMSKDQLIEEFPGMMARYDRFYNMVRSRYARQSGLTKGCPKEVIVISGPPGVGKTRYVVENYPNHIKIDDFKDFDDYDGEETIFLDEFMCEKFPLTFMNRLCDRYSFKFPTRYRTTDILNTTKRIVIATNLAYPCQFYPFDCNRDAFFRRVTKVINL